MPEHADIADLDPDTALRIMRAAERRCPHDPLTFAAVPVSYEVEIDIDIVRRVLRLAPQVWLAQLLACDLHSMRGAIARGEPLDQLAERFRLPVHAVEHVKRRSERSARRDAKLLARMEA